MNKFIQQIEIKVVLKREGRKQFHRRGVGSDLVGALQYLKDTQTGVKPGMFQEVCEQVISASEYIKTSHRSKSSTRAAAKSKVTEVLDGAGKVIGYRRGGRKMTPEQVTAWLKEE